MSGARYVLSVVYRDGVQREVETFDSLPAALTACDEKRAGTSRHLSLWMVHDADDPERGYFDWDRLADMEAQA